MIRSPGFVTHDHRLPVPLDHDRPEGPTIELFAREFVAADKAADGSAESLPYLLFLQGGPGGQGPRPTGAGEWAPALQRYRVLMLDQRGVGRSTRIDADTATGRSAEELAAYLRHFRADAIVADCELLRRHLIGDRPWDTLGQSYGGFITMTYLSRAPEGIRRAFVTGGLPGLHATAEDVYVRTFPRMAARSAEYYTRYPQDRPLVRRLAERLATDTVLLPDGDRLTPRRLQTLGSVFGMSYGFEQVHWLVDRLGDDAQVSTEFSYAVMLATGHTDGPLFALQEYLYGAPGRATRWAAQRERDRHPGFAEDADPLLFTGESMFPWMFRELRALRAFADAADVLADYEDWTALYDLDRLRANEVPVCAAVYFDDVYVDAELQLQTAREVPNVRAWVTNEHEHDGLRDGAVLDRLFAMGDGSV